MSSSNYLLISDLQIPFEHEKALSFCLYLKKYFKIPDENIINVGDEIDEYFGSLYKKDPNGIHTATSEIHASIDKLKKWQNAFPKMKLCISNHGQRWAKKASEAEIPSAMMRTYQEVLQIKSSWQYKLEWRINSRHPFRVIHGMGYSGEKGHINAAIDSGMSTCIGHLHSFGGVAHLRKGISDEYKTAQSIWAMNTGCLIDVASYAFHYGRESRSKPTLGCGVVINNGTTPIFFPLDL